MFCPQHRLLPPHLDACKPAANQQGQYIGACFHAEWKASEKLFLAQQEIRQGKVIFFLLLLYTGVPDCRRVSVAWNSVLW